MVKSRFHQFYKNTWEKKSFKCSTTYIPESVVDNNWHEKESVRLRTNGKRKNGSQ